jgi:NADH-quinone oxidoreductase subunit L
MNLLFLTFLAPLIGYLLLSFSRGRISENTAAFIGVGSLAISALSTLWVGLDFIQHPPQDGVYLQTLWTWMSIGNFAPQFTLRLDGLSLTMLGVVTGVGFFIHLFASWYMRGEEGYSRFFSYMNLFVASMLFLVLGDSLLFLYFGWEGVGLCSYLLIGFYYRESKNGHAAIKAFIVTRIGDVFMALGMFILFTNLGTLNISELLILVPQHWQSGDNTLQLAALLLLGGAVGKSAQLPLQTWLADAMAGPTPVSALIHAATMVTAGVYLIARLHTIFSMSPDVMMLVGAVGGITLVLAGFAAMVQTDIKRILAYSTMSQIGYMFLALGVGAWSGAIFHLMTHAFFKALLFLASGSVIIACHHEQNIFKMGGLAKKLPLTYASFIVGGAALAALPFVTAGFYSKEAILVAAEAGGFHWLLIAGLFGAFMTSIYTFRLIFIVFHGKSNTHEVHGVHGLAHHIPLFVLLVLSTFVGAMIHPPLASVLPAAPSVEGDGGHTVELISISLAIVGIIIAAVLYLGERRLVKAIGENGLAKVLTAWWYNAWGFDWLYNLIFVKPFLLAARINRNDLIDGAIGLLPRLVHLSHDGLTMTQTGRLRWYAASMAAGAVLVLGMLVVTA